MSNGDPDTSGARAYEALHVNALFRQWTQPMLDAARVGPGNRVLDVACGTGVLARGAQQRVGATGSVTGVDIDAGMLAVAEEIEPAVEWVHAEAGALPLPDDSFDSAISQFGLMFFPDRATAIDEMVRCTRPGGGIAIAVWGALERSGAYPTAVEILMNRAGSAAADALRAPFCLGNPDDLREVVEQSTADTVRIETHNGTARFPDIRTMMEAELRGWLPLLGVNLDEGTIADVLRDAERELGHLSTPEGMVFDIQAHIAAATA